MKETIEIDGMTLAFRRIGDGPRAVVVMHGWGCNADTVRVLAEACAHPSTTVYALDLPGFGQSSEPADVWGVEKYTDFVEKFLKARGIAKPVLIGHSFGGRIGILYASSRPTDKLILVDAAGIKPRRSLKYYYKVYSYKAARKAMTLLLGKERAEKWAENARRRKGSSDYAAASPMMRRILSRCVNEDLSDRLPLIKASTLLVWGEKDTATPLRDARKMERLIPDAGLVSYPEAGHYSFLDRPGQTAAVLKSFLKLN